MQPLLQSIAATVAETNVACAHVFTPELEPGRRVTGSTILNVYNLRLLCLVVNVCRETARRPRYKFLAD